MRRLFRFGAALALCAAAALSSVSALAADFSQHKSAAVVFSLLHNRIGGDSFEASRGGTGLSEHIADIVVSATNAEKILLQQVSLYPNSYGEILDVAQREQRENARPELKSMPDVSDCDVVFLVFPCWWGSYPMAYATFFDTGALAGKTVIPLVTNAGSRFGRSMQDLRAALPQSRVLDGLAIRDRDVYEASTEAEVRKFLADLSL